MSTFKRYEIIRPSREIPIMAMTAPVMTADPQRITDAEFGAYQSQPIKVKDFVAAVERLLCAILRRLDLLFSTASRPRLLHESRRRPRHRLDPYCVA